MKLLGHNFCVIDLFSQPKKKAEHEYKKRSQIYDISGTEAQNNINTTRILLNNLQAFCMLQLACKSCISCSHVTEESIPFL